MTFGTKCLLLLLCAGCLGSIVLLGTKSSTPRNPGPTVVDVERHPPEMRKSVVPPGRKLSQSETVPPLGPSKKQPSLPRGIATRVSVNWNDFPLSQLPEFLRRQGGLNVHLDRSALEESSIERNAPVTLLATNLTIESVLHHALKPLNLAWYFDDDVLKITTQSHADRALVTHVYDVRKIEESVRKIRERIERRRLEAGVIEERELLFSRIRQAKIRPRLSDGHSDRRAEFDPVSDFRLADKIGLRILEEAIQSGTLPGNWEEVDGSDGSFLEFEAGFLAVRQTSPVLAKTAQFFQVLALIAGGKTERRSVLIRPSATYPKSDDDVIYAKLRERVSFDTVDLPLSDAIDDLRQSTGLSIRVDATALKKENVSLDETIAINVENVTLRSAIKLMLEPLGLSVFVDYGMLVITSTTKANKHLQAVVYNVNDFFNLKDADCTELIALLQLQISQPQLYGFERIVEPIPGILLISQTEAVHNEIQNLLAELRCHIEAKKLTWMKRRPKKKDKPIDPNVVEIRVYIVEPAETLKGLLKTIPQFIAPETWNKPGIGLIRVVGNRLVVRQSVKVHREIKQFLQKFPNRP